MSLLLRLCQPCCPSACLTLRRLHAPATFRLLCSRPGYVNPTGTLTDECTACGVNEFQPAPGQETCSPCAAGSETKNDANTECTPCSKGFYKSTVGISNFCVEAPAGTYVNTTSAKTFFAW